MKFSSKKKLIPAIAMLLVSVISLTTASYAWFSISGDVVANNIVVKATADNGLLINDAGTGAYADSADADEVYTTSKMRPASSLDALNFFEATTDIANADGAPSATSTIVDLTEADEKLENGTASEGVYADFTFNIKAANATNTLDVFLKSVVITATPDNALKNAARVAVLDENGEAITLLEGKNIYKGAGAAYYAGVTGPLNSTTWTGESDADHLIELDTTGTKIIAGQNNTAPTTITLRVWIEGQDASCIPNLAGTTISVSATFTSEVAA